MLFSLVGGKGNLSLLEISLFVLGEGMNHQAPLDFMLGEACPVKDVCRELSELGVGDGHPQKIIFGVWGFPLKPPKRGYPIKRHTQVS